MNKQADERGAALIERLGRLINSESHIEGLQPVQWEALRYLSRANRFSKTAAAVTAYLGLTKGTVSQTLKTLEAKGLIRKHVDSTDRRSKRLVLTAKGKRTLEKDPLLTTQSVLSALPGKTRDVLERGLGDLLHNSLEARGRVPFGQCRDCQFFSKKHAKGDPHFCELLSEKLSALDSEYICVEQRPRL